MKLYLSLFFILICLNSNAQTILEKKVIYSQQGIPTKLSNAYGALNINTKGSPFDNTYSSVVEIVDLNEKGFILRNNFKIIHYDNNLNKIYEKDLTGILLDPSYGKIKFYQLDFGVGIVQEFIKREKNCKIGLLNYNGELKVKNINFLESSHLMSKEALIDTLICLNAGSTKNKKEEISNVEESVTQLSAPLSFYSSFVSQTMGTFKSNLYVVDLNGNCELKIYNTNKRNKVEKVYKINIEDFKNIKSQYKAVEFVKDYKLFVDEKTSNFFLFQSIIQNNRFKGFLIFKGNLANDLYTLRILRESDFSKLKINIAYINSFSISNINFQDDQTIYNQNDYILLSFHSRLVHRTTTIQGDPTTKADDYQKGHEGINGLLAKKLFQMSINSAGEIVKAEYVSHSFNCLRHNQMLMLPNKIETFYKTQDYKQQESDLIYSLMDKIDPKKNLFRIIKRNGYSFIIHFKEENSEVEVWKVKF
jgi:hypothetical protein